MTTLITKQSAQSYTPIINQQSAQSYTLGQESDLSGAVYIRSKKPLHLSVSLSLQNVTYYTSKETNTSLPDETAPVSTSSISVDYKKSKNFSWIHTTDPYERLVHLSDLEPRWDGYNAPSFHQADINQALKLYSIIFLFLSENCLDISKFKPFIAPCSDGTILFDWSGKNFPDKELQIYIPRNSEDTFEYLKTQENIEEEGDFQITQLIALLNWLFESMK